MSRYIPDEELQEIKKIDLLTYLQNYDSGELRKISRNTYVTQTHGSVKINSDGSWRRWTRGTYGRSALDYFVKVEGYSFLEAAHHIKDLINNTPPTFIEVSKSEDTSFTLPDKNKSSLTACKYLINRGIDKDIVGYCLFQDHLYESKSFHNVVFVGKDTQGEIRYASVRGTTEKKFHGEVSNSDKRFSFSLSFNPKNTTLHIFECPIDLLSYATILKTKGRNWKNENYLSLAGVYKKDKDTIPKPPLALEEYLKNHSYIKTIVTHLDNDEVGIGATELITELYADRYEVIDKTPKQGNDVNKYLCLLLENKAERMRINVR